MSTNIVFDQENAPNRILRGKGNQAAVKNGRKLTPTRKRAVLANISRNVRIQPSRTAKQGFNCDDENETKLEIAYSSSDNNFSTASSRSSSDASVSAPSFEIYQDPTPKPKSKASIEEAYRSPTKHRATEEDNKENIPIRKWPTVLKLNQTEKPEYLPKDLPVLQEDILKVEESKLYDVLEYCEDIYHHNRISELLHKPKPNYMQKQTDISYHMRWILVDWLVEVAEEYNLSCQCLHLAVSYVDRFLSHMSVKRDKLQLVGITAMFIAAKFEEIYPPEVSQFSYITDSTYRPGQILRMEHLILKVLNFDMSSPTAHVFINEYARFARMSDENLYLAQFIAELSMLDADPFLKYIPSIIGAAATALANYTLGQEAWPEELSKKTLYSLDALKDCYRHLDKAFSNAYATKSHAIKDKFKNSKFHCVANLSPREGLPW